MAHIERITDFDIPSTLGTTYGRLVEAVQLRTLGPTVRQAVEVHTRGARRVYLYEAASSAESRLRFHSCEPGVAALFPFYLDRRQLDPVCEAYRAAPHTGDVVLQRVRPSDIASADFRRPFFDDAGIIERLSIVQRGPTAWRAMNVARHEADGNFSDTELTNIVGLACLALPLLGLDGDPPAPGLGDLEARFGLLFPELSRRECQVCARAAKGMSIEATAIDLHIGKASVQTYRRRAYERLGISSPFELSALVSH